MHMLLVQVQRAVADEASALRDGIARVGGSPGDEGPVARLEAMQQQVCALLCKQHHGQRASVCSRCDACSILHLWHIKEKVPWSMHAMAPALPSRRSLQHVATISTGICGISMTILLCAGDMLRADRHQAYKSPG